MTPARKAEIRRLLATRFDPNAIVEVVAVIGGADKRHFLELADMLDNCAALAEAVPTLLTDSDALDAVTKEREKLQDWKHTVSDFVRTRIPVGQNLNQADSAIGVIGCIVIGYDRAEKAEASLSASEARVRELEGALTQMVEEKADYMRINNLGDPEVQHTIKVARAALSLAEGKTP